MGLTLEGRLEKYLFVEMSLQDALALGDEVQFLSENTGFNFDYSSSTYDEYKFDDRISFPIKYSDESYHPKTRVLGVVSGKYTRVYTFSDFEESD